jgi:acetyl-CoA carboxylase biotin carboxyl carrier protein
VQPSVGAHVVVSPSPGILWRSPEPGLPPFAEVGDTVDASSTVCIVEVMKLMNHVKAGVAGEVLNVYGANGASVHKGEALFAIAPSGSPS